MPTYSGNLTQWLRDEVARFDASVPLDAAWLPPSSWYNDARFYELERDTVFRNNWLIAARADQVRNPGDYVAGMMTGEPHVIVRNEGGMFPNQVGTESKRSVTLAGDQLRIGNPNPASGGRSESVWKRGATVASN